MAKLKDRPAEVSAIEGDEVAFDIDASAPVAFDSRRLAADYVAPHALDAAPVNSKIVVVRQEGAAKPVAVLAGPDGHRTLDADDPASKLPEGAVIRKIADGKFQALQLSPAIDYPILTTTTATDAIAQFVPYFHRAT